jgi:hypothetical protein
MWNAFPLHPHVSGKPLSNRSHTARERQQTAWTIEELVLHLKPKRLVAIGNDASLALGEMGFEHEKVRHPSYGGQREFIEAMEKLHGLEPVPSRDLFAA